MFMYDIIDKKRKCKELTQQEIEWFIKGVTDGSIPDYQISALLMAICINGMSVPETVKFTQCMACSGDIIDLSSIEGFKVDKHSTGGVGDKTTLIAVPVVASCGVKVAKMSGRGLGYTGGTVDKLESVQGFNTALRSSDFYNIVNAVGAAMVGQTGNLAPADKILYALRDVTATVESIPLIASSIMSKKLASGADGIVLDVKVGSGGFMKTVDDAVKLSQLMVDIGELNGKKTLAIVTDMNSPLGYSIGNSLEVIEAVIVLEGNGPEKLTEVSLELAANMLFLAGVGDIEKCKQMAKNSISDKSALNKLKEIVNAQGGDSRYISDTTLFCMAAYHGEVISNFDGYISGIDAFDIGKASVSLGAGRQNKESIIDHSAGIVLRVEVGDKVAKGDVIAELYTSLGKENLEAAKQMLVSAFKTEDIKPCEKPLIIARVHKDGVERY